MPKQSAFAKSCGLLIKETKIFPVIKQHYVPQFIMRNLADENGLLCIIDKQSSPIRAIESKSTAILFENDMYETKNLDGSYFDRNVIENKFAQIEGYIANVLKAVDSELSKRRTLRRGLRKQNKSLYSRLFLAYAALFC